MRWPFTPYGTGTLLAFAVPLAALSVVLALTTPGAWWLAPLPLFAFVVSFFRDPERRAEGGEDDLVSPADGTVSDVVELDEPSVGGPATRIGIFLSVFNVHVNRAPCAGEVLEVEHREGSFHDARDRRAIDENQAATIVLGRPDGRRLAVRQITGLIARRIICPVQRGDRLDRGQRYGMIRFGSRTELIVPTAELGSVLVAVGDSVRGGHTLLATLIARPSGGTPAPMSGGVEAGAPPEPLPS